MIAGRNEVIFSHRLFAVGGFVGLEAPRADELGQADTRRGIVLDDQDALGTRQACSLVSVSAT